MALPGVRLAMGDASSPAPAAAASAMTLYATLYHATLWSRVSWLVQHGIRPHVRSPWRNALGGRIVERGYIYAWDSDEAAVLWAAKMRWEFGPGAGLVTPLVAIVTFQDARGTWEPDPCPTLVAPGGLRKRGIVPGAQLTASRLVFPWEIRAAIAGVSRHYRRVQE